MNDNAMSSNADNRSATGSLAVRPPQMSALPGPAGAQHSQGMSPELAQRIAGARTWGPLLAAMLLDVADLVSFGPQGVPIGLLIGSTLGWAVAAQLGMGRGVRLMSAVAGAVYCMVPGTELIPLASIATAVARWRQLLGMASYPGRS
jgi:hypothetical protein